MLSYKALNDSFIINHVEKVNMKNKLIFNRKQQHSHSINSGKPSQLLKKLLTMTGSVLKTVTILLLLLELTTNATLGK